MARPPKIESEKKNTDLRIPVTKEQKELIHRAIALDGQDMAAWARPILLREAKERLRRGAGNR